MRLAWLLLLAAPLFAQFSRPISYFPYDPVGGCSSNSNLWNNTGGHLYKCRGSSWTIVDGAASSFADLLAGTNTKALTMGTGGIMSYAGGIVNANFLLGVNLSSITGVVKMTTGIVSPVAGSASDCVKVDGSSGPCGSMGSSVDALTIQEGTRLAVSSGSGTAYVGTPATATPSYAVGEVFIWQPDVTNSGTTPTLTVSGLGAKTIIHKSDGSAMATSELDTAQICYSLYNGTSMLTWGCFTGPGTISMNVNNSLATPGSGVGNIGFNGTNKAVEAKASDGTDSSTVIDHDCTASNYTQKIQAGTITCAQVTIADLPVFSSAALAARLTDESGTGVVCYTISCVMTTPNLGTPSAVNLTNGTALPIAGIAGLGTGVAAALGTTVSGTGAFCLASGSACAGGGGSPVSSLWWPFGQIANSFAVATPTLGTGNKTIFFEILIPSPGIILKNITGWNNAGAPGNVAWAMYDSTCTLITNGTSSTVNATANVVNNWVWSPTLSLPGGDYYLALTGDTTTMAFFAPFTIDMTDLANVNESAGTLRIFSGTASTGTTTLVFPGTCGTRTTYGASVAAYPAVVLH